MASCTETHDTPQPTGARDGVKIIIQENQVHVVKELDVDVFWQLIKSSVDTQMSDVLDSQENRVEKMSQVLDCLPSYLGEQHQGFYQVCAGLCPDVFYKVKGRVPTNDEQGMYVLDMCMDSTLIWLFVAKEKHAW